MSLPIASFFRAMLPTWGLVENEAMASGLPCIVSNACGCSEDLVQPIRPDLCYPVGDTSSLARAMSAAIANSSSQQVLQAQISKYDVSRTVDAVETLYFDALARSAAKSDRVSE
jgi:glycosyltransferase involved in cell wall biosynthesis